jgi:predicted amidophosphoribosyltransferase
MQINGQKLTGSWKAGWALDFHTVSSIPRPDGGFDTQRTEIGELLYQLKYKNDKSKIEPIAEIAAAFIKKRLVFPYLTAIIPVPPSKMDRPFQPVQELALKIGQKVNLPVPLDYLIKVKETEPLKSVEDLQVRKEQLKGAFKVKDNRFAGKYVLLFDDLFRSGETLSEITDVLVKEGKVSKVFVLTITKTRTRR